GAGLGHEADEHAIDTGARSLARRLFGRGSRVASEHHQAAHRIGRGLRASSGSADGVVESLELPRRRLALGIQWHPERQGTHAASARLADALVEAAA
ncbi:MAG: putative glutamine amidotransferase, partial [Thermoleophilaceae bacterium]|nr:putative glutamine amidotransferase [Thermoleophilaceae bacterium]